MVFLDGGKISYYTFFFAPSPKGCLGILQLLNNPVHSYEFAQGQDQPFRDA